MGAHGFASVPGWIKLENGQRSPSEKLIEKLVSWLVSNKHVRSSAAKELKEELLTLKYMGSRSAYLRELAHHHAKGLTHSAALLAPRPAGLKPTRGRPRLATTR